MLADRRCCPLTFLSIAHTPTLIFLAPCLQSGACTHNSIARLRERRGQHRSTAVLCCVALASRCAHSTSSAPHRSCALHVPPPGPPPGAVWIMLELRLPGAASPGPPPPAGGVAGGPGLAWLLLMVLASVCQDRAKRSQTPRASASIRYAAWVDAARKLAVPGAVCCCCWWCNAVLTLFVSTPSPFLPPGEYIH